MIMELMAALAVLQSAIPPKQLIRQDRQDTIYVLHGDKAALEALRRGFGEDWAGTILDDDPADGELTYWAYSERTAAESRALMMPAIKAGLEMRFERFDEAMRFPVERTKLDQIAIRCGATTDPFFLTPKRTVEITPSTNADSEHRDCLSQGIKVEARLLITTSAHIK